MRLNHIDLPVPDVAATRDFFETWLGFTHERTLGQDGLSILRDESRPGAGAQPAAPRRGPDLAGPVPHRLPPGEPRRRCRSLHARMAAGGLAVDPPATQHGAFGFYLTAPGDILVEVAHRA
jgi:catechol 2,3-dioxygenase-like lactoylglutathione lyase family enzyme